MAERRAKRDKELEALRITAQPIGERFGVDTRGLEHFSKNERGVVSDNERTMAPGCYRRLPTNNE